MTKILGLALVAVLAANCGGDNSSTGNPGGLMNGTNDQVTRRVGVALCERVRTCYADRYAAIYPTGAAACIDELVATTPPSTLTQINPCTDAEVQACSNDAGLLSCQAIAQNPNPPSCAKCDPSGFSQTGPNGTGAQVLRNIGWAVCARLRSCVDAATWTRNYPGGTIACVDRLASAAPPSQAAAIDACSDADVKVCRADLKAAACDALIKATYPSSCTKC